MKESKYTEPFIFNDFDNMENSNSVVWKSIKKILPKVIETELTSQQAAAIKAHFYERLKQKEIAERMGISQPTVCRLINLGTKTLLNRLSYAMEVGKMVSVYYETEVFE